MGDTTGKLVWETPATVPLTDTDSRADQADVLMGNGVPPGPDPGSF
jgi:hypothetical protein